MQIFSCWIVSGFREFQMLGPSSCLLTCKEVFQYFAPGMAILHIPVKY